VPVVVAQVWRRSLLARGGAAALSGVLARLQPVSLLALLLNSLFTLAERRGPYGGQADAA